jgi:ATP-dependent DNA helicase RecQ
MFTVRKEELYKLNEGGRDADLLMRTLLRSYTGIFADHVFIEETYLSRTTGIPVEKIYFMLKEMSHRRIVSYIPKRSTPTITFLTPRVESHLLNIPRSVYEDRKADYQKRLTTMIDYMTSNDKCRSQILLEYFGQDSPPLCQQCDVCIAHKKESKSNAEHKAERIRSLITEKLKDGEFHHITELNTIRNVPRELLDSVLHHMAEEEEIEIKLSRIRLSKQQ